MPSINREDTHNSYSYLDYKLLQQEKHGRGRMKRRIDLKLSNF